MTERLDYRTHAAGGIKALVAVQTYLRQSGLPEILLDLVYLRASQINGCAFCLDMHSRDLLKRGVPVEKLALVQAWREAGNLFTAQEQAALRWTETVTRVSETGVPDEEFEAVSQSFSPKELADLTIAIGMINTWNRLAISFRATPAAVKG